MKGSGKSLQERLPFRLRNSRGSLLVLSLWVILILGSFSISMGYHVRQKITLANRLDIRNQLYGMAEAGVREVLILLKQKSTSSDYDMLSEPWSVSEELFRDILIGEGSFTVSYDYVDSKDGTRKTRYGVQDEESKINLNTASPKVLSTILQIMAGLKEKKANSIGYSIVDWRDSDSFLNHPTHGAEDDYYEDLDFSYGAKDSDFQVLDELLLVRDMTSEIFSKVRDKLTVYGDGEINVNTASREVLLALGLGERLVNKILDYRAGTDREEATQDDRAFTQVKAIAASLSGVFTMSSSEVASVSNLLSAKALSVQSKHFRVRSRGELKNGLTLDITAVFQQEDGSILFWSAGIPQRK